MRRGMALMALGLLLVGCATAPQRPVTKFPATAKGAPPPERATVYLGTGVVVHTIDEQEAEVAGSSKLLLTPGTHTLAVSFFYEDVRLDESLTLPEKESVTVTVAANETWALTTSFDQEFSTTDVLPPARLKQGHIALKRFFGEAPIVRYRWDKVTPTPTLARKGYDYLELYVGPTIPFFTPDSAKLLLTNGTYLKVLDAETMTPLAKFAVGTGDLIGGVAEGPNQVFLINRKGEAFRVELDSQKVTGPLATVGALKKVVMTKRAVFVQSSENELSRLDRTSFETRPILTSPEPILDWTVAFETEAYVVQTAKDRKWFDPDGKVFHTMDFAEHLLDREVKRVASPSLDPEGRILAFVVDGRVKAFTRDKPNDLGMNQWDLMGHSASLPQWAQRVFWANSQLGVIQEPGGDRVLALWPVAKPGQNLLVPEGLSGALTDWNTGTSSPLVSTAGAFSPDGKKAVYQGMGGPFGAPVFYAVIAANVAKPKAPRSDR